PSGAASRTAALPRASEMSRRASGGSRLDGVVQAVAVAVAVSVLMVFSPMRIGLRQHALDLGRCHHRQEAYEQAEHREEQPEAPEQTRHVPARRPEVAPGTRAVVTVERREGE